jgi:hypothetical protein
MFCDEDNKAQTPDSNKIHVFFRAVPFIGSPWVGSLNGMLSLLLVAAAILLIACN